MRAVSALGAMGIALLTSTALAAPLTVTHSGYVLDGLNAPVSDTLEMRFALYTSADGTLPAWTSDGTSNGTGTACGIDVENGYYVVALGGASSTGGDNGGCGAGLTTEQIPGGAPLFLEVRIGSTVMRPRHALNPVPLAARSQDTTELAERLKRADGAINTPGNPVHWNQLVGVPADIADGNDDSAVYSAAGGLALFGSVFQIADGGVTTVKIGNAQVTEAKLAMGAVTSDKLASGAVTQAKIGGSAVGTSQLADASVTKSKLSISAGELPGTWITNKTVGANQLADGAVTTLQILDGTITGADIAQGTITADKLAHGAGSSLNADLLDGIDSTQFLRRDVDSTHQSNLGVAGTLSAGALNGPLVPAYRAFQEPGAANGGAAIYNDSGTYKALVITGNRSAGVDRQVRVYDDLWVADALTTVGPAGIGGQLTVGGNLIAAGSAHTLAGSVSITGGRLYLSTASTNHIAFGTQGVAPPSNADTGWKIRTWGSQYGIGIEDSSQWYAAGSNHRWYSGDGTAFTRHMTLDQNGTLSLHTGGISFDQANPTIAASSYIHFPGGAYFNGGTVYFSARSQHRGGIGNDTAPSLTIYGGTTGLTHFPGNVQVDGYSSAARFDGVLTPRQQDWSSQGTGFAGAAIYNDGSGYKKLMIVGNDSGGGGRRRIGLWDDVQVSGDLNVGGTISSLSGITVAQPRDGAKVGSTATATCPAGKRVLFAMGFLADISTSTCAFPNEPCGGPAFPNCIGSQSCSYTGANSRGCSNIGPTCLRVICG